MAVGTSVLAGFTDFLFQDDFALPLYCARLMQYFTRWQRHYFGMLPAYRASLAEAGNWRV